MGNKLVREIAAQVDKTQLGLTPERRAKEIVALKVLAVTALTVGGLSSIRLSEPSNPVIGPLPRQLLPGVQSPPIPVGIVLACFCRPAGDIQDSDQLRLVSHSVCGRSDSL